MARFDAGLTACVVRASFEAAVSSVLNGRSGEWQNITTNLDIASIGITAQRADQLSGYVYSPKTIIKRLSRDAFTPPSLAHTQQQHRRSAFLERRRAPRVANLVERPSLEILRRDPQLL